MPTVPTPETVLRIRHTAVIVVRSVAVLLVVIWVYQGTNNTVRLLNSSRSTGSSLGVYQLFRFLYLPGLALPVLAAAIAVFAPRLVKWIVPMPRPGCPFCDHEALPESGVNCPECGRELPEQLRR